MLTSGRYFEDSALSANFPTPRPLKLFNLRLALPSTSVPPTTALNSSTATWIHRSSNWATVCELQVRDFTGEVPSPSCFAIASVAAVGMKGDTRTVCGGGSSGIGVVCRTTNDVGCMSSAPCLLPGGRLSVTARMHGTVSPSTRFRFAGGRALRRPNRLSGGKSSDMAARMRY